MLPHSPHSSGFHRELRKEAAERHPQPRSRLGRVVLHFTPSWFAVNMGTGIVSAVEKIAPCAPRHAGGSCAAAQPGCSRPPTARSQHARRAARRRYQFPGMEHVATAFFLLNIVLFVIFMVVTVARYIAFPWVLWRMLNHPAQCAPLPPLARSMAHTRPAVHGGCLHACRLTACHMHLRQASLVLLSPLRTACSPNSSSGQQNADLEKPEEHAAWQAAAPASLLGRRAMFAGTLPMGLATIVTGIVLIAVPYWGPPMAALAWALWWVDVALTLAACFGIPFIMFFAHQLTLEHMTAAWLFPIVPAVVAAATGGVVAGVLPTEQAMLTLAVSYMLWCGLLRS